MYLLGYYFGKRDGTIKGMSSLFSIFKVYNPDLIKDISKTFDAIKAMSPEDKENAFYDYIEKINSLGGTDVR
jgi:hypothetical protein